MKHSRAGLTLTEVLVALTLLAVGAAALSAWQLTSLQIAVRAQQQQQLVQLVSAELDFRALVPGLGSECSMLAHITAAAEFSCSVHEETCGFRSGEVHCPASPGERSLRRVSVKAEHRAGEPLELSLLGGPTESGAAGLRREP